MRFSNFIPAATLALMCLSTAQAELIVGGALYQYLSLGIPNVPDGTEQYLESETGPIEVSDSREKSDSGISGSYFAQADYGVVRIKTVATGRAGGWAAGAQSFAQANDYITVFGAPEGATLRAVIALEGWGNDTGGDSAYLSSNWMGFAQTHGSGPNCAQPIGRLNGQVSVLCETYVSVENGASYYLPMHLAGSSESHGTTMILDFSHTARLQSLGVYDATGNLLNDVTIQTASGTVYPTASAVPEPSSFAVVAGALALAVYRRVRSASNAG